MEIDERIADEVDIVSERLYAVVEEVKPCIALAAICEVTASLVIAYFGGDCETFNNLMTEAVMQLQLADARERVHLE